VEADLQGLPKALAASAAVAMVQQLLGLRARQTQAAAVAGQLAARQQGEMAALALLFCRFPLANTLASQPARRRLQRPAATPF
jgi:hypothetical protein